MAKCSSGNPLPARRRRSRSRSRTRTTSSATRACSSSFSQTLTATEVFNLGRFGEVASLATGRLYTPTAITTPGAAAIAQEDQNNRSRIVLDDGNNQQNIDPTRYPQGGLSAANTLRVGDTLPGLTGVMDYRFASTGSSRSGRSRSTTRTRAPRPRRRSAAT